MHAIAISDAHVDSSHVTVPASELVAGTTVQITDYDLYRHPYTDELVYHEQTWQATVERVERAWNAPSEVEVHFTDGPPAWVLRDANIPVVMGPVNASGKF
jgi:hypothetical protein